MSLISTMCESSCLLRRPQVTRDNAKGTVYSFGRGLKVNITAAGGITAALINTPGVCYPPSAQFLLPVIQSGGNNGQLLVTTNASGTPTAVQIFAPGTGYSTATAVSTGGSKIMSQNMPCSCQENNASANDLYGQRNTFNSTMLYFPSDPFCEVNDRAEVLNTRTKKKTFYLIEGEAQPVARERIYHVQVTRIRQPV